MKLLPYFQLMRLHQPTGIFLLLWPCWWGVALASDGLPPVTLLLLFAVGALVMRGAGCVVNDWWDREFDREVERTRNRPLASGVLKTPHAFGLLAILLAVAFAVMLALPLPARWLAVLSLPLVVLYPLMKRVTWWPQAFLGLTFNWGALMGWASVQGNLDTPALLLYAAGFFWTLGYDTVYACQDLKDDTRIGVKSTARHLALRLKPMIAVFYLCMLTLLASAGIVSGIGHVFLFLLLMIAALLCLEISRLNPNLPERCMAQFKAHGLIGGFIFVAILSDKL